MTVQAMPWAIQGQSHPAVNANNVTAAMFGAPVAVVAAAASLVTAGGGHGVVDSGDLAVTQNGTPDMSVNVAAGRAIIRSGGSSSILQGCYALLNDATVNVVIAAADPTNPRIDYIVAQVRDSNYGEAAADARIVAITGTPAASPSAPALTLYPNCVVLAQIAVAASAASIVTANITDKRTRAYALGGVCVCTSTTRPTGASLHPGLEIFETDTGLLRVYTVAGAWRTIANTTPTNGTVLQVQSVTVTAATFSTTSTSFTDVTGLTVNITPSNTSSKIMCFVDFVCGASASTVLSWQLCRNGTAIGAAAAGNTLWILNSDEPFGRSFQYLDSPATAAAATYKLQVKVNANAMYLNRRGATDTYNGTSTITVMEVAGS